MNYGNCLPLCLDSNLKKAWEKEKKWLSSRILINYSSKVKNRDFDNAISDFDYKDSMSFFDATRILAVIIREEGRKESTW